MPIRVLAVAARSKADPRRICYVEFELPHVLGDVDTPEDYAWLSANIGSRSGFGDRTNY